MESLGVIVFGALLISIIAITIYGIIKHARCPKCKSKFGYTFSEMSLIWSCSCGYVEGDKIES